MAAWMNDPEVRKHLDQRVFPVGVGAERKWVDGVHAQITAKTGVVLMVRRQSDQVAVASSGMHDINWLARWAEFGIVVPQEHWGQGYGQEATERMLQYAFEELNLNAVRLRVNGSHERAIRCYERAGYQGEGVLRQASVVGGKPEDIVVMSILRAEWESRLAGAPSILGRGK